MEHIEMYENGEFKQCLCGNTPDRDGFYACNADGYEVEPTPEAWPVPLYICYQCGRIVNGVTAEVVGQRDPVVE